MITTGNVMANERTYTVIISETMLIILFFILLNLLSNKSYSIFQRSLRALSTIAAVIGFILILSGVLVNVHIAGGGATFAPSAASP